MARRRLSEVAELDLNPVIALPRMHAVDARVRIAAPSLRPTLKSW
jgi:hypothetical protein